MNTWIDGLKLSENAEPREEIMLFPYGVFYHPTYGKLDFTEKFHNEVIKNYNEDVLKTKPFMDAEHDMGKALAWFDSAPYYKEGVGTFIKPSYTELGKELLSKKIYKYFSPWFEDFADPQTKKVHKNVLRGGGATNIPFLKTMPPIVEDGSKFQEGTTFRVMLSELSDSDNGGGVNADEPAQTLGEPETKSKEKSMNKIIEALKLAEGSNEDAVVEAISKLAAKVAELSAAQEPNKELSDKLVETEKKLADVNIKLVEKERDTVLQNALTAGKIKPADLEYWQIRFMSDPAGITADLDKMGNSVVFGEVGSNGEVPEAEEGELKIMTEANKLAEEKKISVSDALVAIMREKPELAKDYESKCFTDPRRKIRIF